MHRTATPQRLHPALPSVRVARQNTQRVRAIQPHVAKVGTNRTPAYRYTSPPYEPEQPVPLNINLPVFKPDSVDVVDVVIAGAGPAGIATASRIAWQGLSVVVVDPDPAQQWPNNYGVWCDEFEAMGLEDCFETKWSKATVWLWDDDERPLQRPYARVDRCKLKQKLLRMCVANDVAFHRARVAGCEHEASTSTVTCADGSSIETRLVVDATGHARRLTEMDGDHNPGYQAAYGVTAEVDSHPFDLDTMLFMDWRDAHLKRVPRLREENAALPTFLYAMPFSPTRVFVEETSLVARPGVPFAELKERLYARLEHMGIQVNRITEEEYCLIPMGGVLPRRDQRVIGVGGTAGLVHPSTGYMVARTLGAVPQLADRIVDELSTPLRNAQSPQEDTRIRSQRMWESIWPSERLQQREFMTFGMEVLLKLDLEETREFFSAFFSLSDFHWKGFLSSRLSFVQLFVFGLSLFVNATPAARTNLIKAGLPLLPGMFWQIARSQQQLPKNVLGREAPAAAAPAGSGRPAQVGAGAMRQASTQPSANQQSMQ